MAVSTKKVSKVDVAATKLEQEHSAISLSFSLLGTRRTLSTSQRDEAASVFEADGQSFSASKKLLNTNHEKYKKIMSIKSEIYVFWKDNSLPYPEDGIRLFPKKNVEKTIAFFTEKKQEFRDAVASLDECYHDLVEEAKSRLGRLYNPSDYPASIKGSFDVEWNFRNINPPDYLMQLNPTLFEEERRKMQLRFQDAVRLAEQAFQEELKSLVEHLVEKLSGRDEKGQRSIFRNSTVDNLNEFFDKFQNLNVGSNAQLEELVKQAKGVLKGVDVVTLRHDYATRDNLAEQMGKVKEQLDTMMEVAPRRKIVRGGYSAATNGEA